MARAMAVLDRELQQKREELRKLFVEHRTADGIYIWGNPADPGPERIWGKPVVQSTYQTENTGVVGDFAMFSELAVRRGIEVQVSNSHSTYFIEGKLAIRADMRAALLFYRPKAFCQVTGI